MSCCDTGIDAWAKLHRISSKHNMARLGGDQPSQSHHRFWFRRLKIVHVEITKKNVTTTVQISCRSESSNHCVGQTEWIKKLFYLSCLIYEDVAEVVGGELRAHKTSTVHDRGN